MNMETFCTIFKDAELIDLDFSNWDRFIRFVVISDHVDGVWINNRRPIYNVDFVAVKSISFNLLNPIPKLENPEDRCVWHVHEYRINRENDCYHIAFQGLGPSPETQIVCEEIHITYVLHDTLDKHYGNWNKPRSGFVRKSIEELTKKTK